MKQFTLQEIKELKVGTKAFLQYELTKKANRKVKVYEGKVTVIINDDILFNLKLLESNTLGDVISMGWTFDTEILVYRFSRGIEYVENFKLFELQNKWQYINA